jgi:hypothetical protein
MQICLQDCSVHYTGAIFSVSLRLTLWSHIWQSIDAFVTLITIVMIDEQIFGAGVVGVSRSRRSMIVRIERDWNRGNSNEHETRSIGGDSSNHGKLHQGTCHY